MHESRGKQLGIVPQVSSAGHYPVTEGPEPLKPEERSWTLARGCKAGHPTSHLARAPVLSAGLCSIFLCPKGPKEASFSQKNPSLSAVSHETYLQPPSVLTLVIKLYRTHVQRLGRSLLKRNERRGMDYPSPGKQDGERSGK